MRKNYHSNTAFLDLLFNFLLATMILLTIAVVFIVTEQNKADIKTKAEFVITISWNEEYDNDVDVWVEDPLGRLLWYRQKEAGLMHLDRDDMGHRNDITEDGKVIRINQEIVTIRGCVEGEWVVNLHLYKKHTREPTDVEVSFIKLNPKATLIFGKRFTLIDYWEQITVARLYMTRTGRILQVDDGPYKDLIQMQVVSPYSTQPGETP